MNPPSSVASLLDVFLGFLGLQRHQLRVQVAGPAAFGNVAGDVAVDALGVAVGAGLGRDLRLENVVAIAANPPARRTLLPTRSTLILDERHRVGNGADCDPD